jgi:hypothetical protein
MRLQDNSTLLEEQADLFQGIKVGANDIFIMTADSTLSLPTVSVKNGLGAIHALERDLLRPVVYGSEIRRYLRIGAGHLLLYPYRDGELIPLEQLEQEYPFTFRYLMEYREVLASRGSVSGASKAWYGLVRQRNEEWLSSKKLLTRDMAMRPSFALDDEGSTYLVGGTAVIPSNPDLLLPLLGYLNSQIVNWYLSPLTPSFRADFQKFEPQHLGKIPVLRAVVEPGEINDKLTALTQLALDAASKEDTISAQKIEG